MRKKLNEILSYDGMRASIPPGWWRMVLCALCAAMAFPCHAQEGAGGLESYPVSITDNLSNGGYIDVRVPIYDTKNYSECVTYGYIYLNDQAAIYYKNAFQGNYPYHWCKINPSNTASSQVMAYAETMVTAGVKFSATLDGYNYDEDYTGKENTWQQIVYGGRLYPYKADSSNGKTSALIRIYPTEAILKQKSITVKVTYRKTISNDTGGGPYTTSKTFSYTIPEMPEMGWKYSSTPGKQSVYFNGNKGDKYKVGASGAEQVVANTGEVAVDFDVANTSRNVSIQYFKKVSDYQHLNLGTTTIKIPALYYPDDFTASMETVADADGSVKETGNVVLSWSVANAPSDAEKDDMFEVQRSSDSGFTTVKTIGSGLKYNGNGNYRLVDETSKENLNDRFYYRLRRNKVSQWQWLYTKNASLDISMKHRMIGSARAKMSDDGSVVIDWDYDDGNVWSDKSTIMLVRMNEQTSATLSYAIPEEAVAKGSYSEKLPTTCDVYTYKIYVKPGNTLYSQQEPLVVESEEPIYTVSIGKVLDLSVSKGYYSDRVAIEWTSDGNPVDVFSIHAREYGKGGQFKLIDSVDGNAASLAYSYSDTKAVPGVIYEYKVVSTSKCGSKNQSIESHTEYGFRTPTGDIYGRVTFENGQGVPEAEVRAEATDNSDIPGKSYKFKSGDLLTVADTTLLEKATNAATLQAWVRTDADGTVVKKDGMYELAIEGGKPVFKVAGQKVEAGNLSDYRQDGEFVNLTGVMNPDSVFVFVNGKQAAKAKRTAAPTGSATPITIGGNSFVGNIDEVRIWSKALSADTIARDYNRMLVGNEVGLEALYTFNYSVASNFYDTSYHGTEYNSNHGIVTGAEISNDVPTDAQLGYKAITGVDGSYAIRALPYSGNGTSYMIIPRLGIHTFESTKELRLISSDSQTHTVNFTDKSSFPVSGKVTYFGGTVPVEGVSFTVDGTTVMDGKGKVVVTDAKGMFTINVPVGTHEVKAVKQKHIFVNEGRITNSDGTDRNYQDMISGIELQDSTTVRYIGRVAGGAVQEALPVGHSLSKNNLGDGIKVTLTYQNEAYELNTTDREETKTHFRPLWQKKANTNKVEFSGNTVTIYPNLETGEFVADLVPEKYKILITAPGHDDKPIQGSGEELNLTSAFTTDRTTYQWVDSISDKNRKIERNDTVWFNRSQQFIKRYTPTVDVYQYSTTGQRLEYFGVDSVKVSTMIAEESYKVELFNKDTGTYTFSRPVFENGQNVKLGIDVFEEYRYKDEKGKDKSGIEPDRAPTSDAVLSFSKSDLPYGSVEDVEADSLGHASLDFIVQLPELTSALRSLSATMTYGNSDNPTSVDWQGKFNAIVLGARMQGANFITKGPDQVLFVLRDPPGSNSYSYLEKGVKRTDVKTYIGSVVNEGSEVFDNSATAKVISWSGVATGLTVENEVRNEMGHGLLHKEQVGGVKSTIEVSEATSRFETSSDPQYVGADGDVYVGYSTNIGFGATDNVQIVSRSDYQKNPSGFDIYTDVSPANSDWLVVRTTGIGINQNVETLFAYPQVHIEEVLIPKMIDVRNSLLHQQAEGTDSEFQALANRDNKLVYVSKLAADNENFGKSNTDKEAFPDQKVTMFAGITGG